MKLRVFIQNEAGSTRKNRHDEKSLAFLRSEEVSRPYPYPYGFIVGTTAADGLNVDCFVLTQQPLRTGDLVTCEPVGLMEQFEDGNDDHNVLARVIGDSSDVTEDTKATLADFVLNVFRHVQNKRIMVGRFLPAHAAMAHVQAHLDPQGEQPA